MAITRILKDPCGDHTDEPYGYGDYWIAYVDGDSADVVWSRLAGSSKIDNIEGVVLLTGGGYLLWTAGALGTERSTVAHARGVICRSSGWTRGIAPLP